MKSNYDNIEAYLNGSLSQEELLEFESALKTDASLSDALNQFKLAKELSKTLIEFETRNHLQQLKNKNHSFNWIYRIAAVLLLGFICFYFLYPILNPPKLDSDQLFASLYEKPASLTYRSETELTNKLDSAIYQFDSGNLDQSQNIFTDIQFVDSLNLLALKYLAHIQLQKRNYPEAQLLLIKLNEFNQEPYKTEALYYLCMLDLINQNSSAAKIKFNQFKNSSLLSKIKIEILENYLK